MTGRLAEFVESHGRALVLVALSLALAGFVLMFQIPISIFPQTDFPRVVVRADNGIAPVDVQMVTVTRPLEEAVRIVPDITEVRSITSRGSTELNIFFRWDTDIYNSLNLVQGRISEILPGLPPGLRFTINRVTFSTFPMIGFSMTSNLRSTSDLWDMAYYELAPRLYRLPAVAQARIVGGKPPEVHVLVDAARLNAYGLPLTRVVDALRNSNIISPSGMLQENYHLYLTTVTGLLRSREQVEDTVVAVVKGTPVTVKDLAQVVPGEEPIYQIVTANGHPAVLVNIYQQPDGNAVAIADAVNNELKSIKKTLASDIDLKVFYDQSILVRQSIRSVAESIVIGLVLSVVVLMLFLRSWRITLVAALVIPVAVLIAIVAMRLFNMSFNLMTLGGLAACIGVVIDDAIVIVENIMVHRGMGQTPGEAAKSAIRELTPALIGSTLTPIMVFAPLVFLGGITAVFFRALALTLVTALLASLVLAIFCTPVLAAVLLPKPDASAHPAASLEQAEMESEGRGMRFLTRWYERALPWGLRHPGIILLAALGLLAGGAALYLNLGSGFLPEMDEGAFVLDYIMPSGTSLTETDRVLRHIERFLAETPEVESYSRRTGAQLGLDIAEPNTGDFLVKLKDKRERSVDDVTAEIRGKIKSSEPSIDVEFAGILGDLVGDLVSSPEPVEIKIFNQNDAVYKRVAQEITDWLPKIRGVVDVTNRTVVIGPSVNFRVDPQKAERAGFSVRDVADLQAAMLDGTVASNIIRDNRSIAIRVRYPVQDRSSMATLDNLLVTSPSGATLPLSSITMREVEPETTEIQRDNLRNLSSVTARLSGRDLGSAIDEIKARLFKEVSIPSGTDIEFGGLYQIQHDSFVSLVQVLCGSILLIFIILVFEFRSFAHPVAILAATILCGSGTLLALWVTGSTLNISSFMGAIMVIGIVHKNGILMLDSEQYFAAQGVPLRDAIFQAGRRRLRPILMTAL
ncbi:MAG: efflux RND transporter permease subunit, partial [Bryobacteraceae bacterium]